MRRQSLRRQSLLWAVARVLLLPSQGRGHDLPNADDDEELVPLDHLLTRRAPNA